MARLPLISRPQLPRQVSMDPPPERIREITAEFSKRLAFVQGNFRFAQKTLRDDQIWFNESLRRLRRRVKSTRKAKVRGERVHPEIETVITLHARRLAAENGREVCQRDANEAARIAVTELKSRPGRPENRALEHHVIGLMALIQNFSGRPVAARRSRNSVYHPHFPDRLSQIVPEFFKNIDRRITTTSLVNIVLRVQREQAGKEQRFLDLFPFYGASVIEGEIKLRPGLRLEAMELNIPIYCP